MTTRHYGTSTPAHPADFPEKFAGVAPEFLPHAQERVADFDRLRELGLICRNGDFFAGGVHYPPITMYEPLTDDKLFEGYSLPADGKLDVYVHIPFCRQRCTFCHYPLQLGPHLEAEKDRYLDALEREMDIYLRHLGVDRIKARSVLAGGGTPTFLTLRQQDRFLEMLTKRVDISHGPQFSVDVDPNTLIGEEGAERLKILRSYGVDRLTIGVQELDDGVLKRMNRHHDSARAIESIQDTLAAGFQVNIEFVFGFAGQTIESWTRTIERACQFGVHEIQLYRLKVDAYGDYQGPIKQVKQKRPAEIPTNEEAVVMKSIAIDTLAKYGYTENLRRVFTRKPEHYSHYAHNQCCELRDQAGFGLTAFSSLRDRFALNTQDFNEYYRLIDEGHLPVNRGLVRGEQEQRAWAMILPLKNRSVRKKDYRRATGGYDPEQIFGEILEPLEKYGLVEITASEVTLTDLGKFFADEVVQQFQTEKHMHYGPDAYASGPLCPFSQGRSNADGVQASASATS
jgi:oxygen-independent coproporphyrinogen-3 oxidase